MCSLMTSPNHSTPMSIQSIGYFAHLVASLLQGTTNEAVLGIHNGRLTVVACLFFYASLGNASRFYNIFIFWQFPNDLLSFLIPFHQLDGEPTGGIAKAQQVVAFQVLLNVTDAVLNLVTMIDMLVTIVLVVTLAILEDMNHFRQQIFQSPTRLERRGDHRHSQQRAELVDAQAVATLLQLIEHIQRTNHTEVHIHQLGCQVEVALQIAGVNDIDDDIGGVVHQLPANVQFLRTIGRQRVSARQVDQADAVSPKVGISFLGIYRHPFVGSRGKVE